MRNPASIIFFAIFAVAVFGALDLPFFIPLIILYFVISASRRKNKPPRNPSSGGPRSRNRNRDYRRQRQAPPPTPRPKPRPRQNPYKKTGVEKYKDYDYDGAIEDFKKSLEIEPTDIPTHFNIACAYSLNENKEQAFYHIDRAVALGFKDFDRIKTHDAFAYLRVQDEFEGFQQSGYRLSAKQKAKPQPEQEANLLEQLRKLADLRDRGILTEEEFLIQKEKLLR